MQTTKGPEMPLLTELLETVAHAGHEATLKALINARNKGVSIDDPIIQEVFNSVLQEISISYEQLVAKNTRGIKQRHGLIIISWSMTMLKYSQANTGMLLGGRSRSQINRYHKMMLQAKAPGRVFQYKEKFTTLIKSLKIKKKNHGHKSPPGTRRKTK